MYVYSLSNFFCEGVTKGNMNPLVIHVTESAGYVGASWVKGAFESPISPTHRVQICGQEAHVSNIVIWWLAKGIPWQGTLPILKACGPVWFRWRWAHSCYPSLSQSAMLLPKTRIWYGFFWITLCLFSLSFSWGVKIHSPPKKIYTRPPPMIQVWYRFCGGPCADLKIKKQANREMSLGGKYSSAIVQV